MVMKTYSESSFPTFSMNPAGRELSSALFVLPSEAQAEQQAEVAIAYGLGLVAFGLITLALLKRI